MNREEMLAVARTFIEKIEPYCSKIEICGSIRRKVEQPNDIDLVIIPMLPNFVSTLIPNIADKVIVKGDKLIRLVYQGIQIDVYFATQKTFETLVLIRTGSEDHNKKLCILAKNKGLQLKADGTGLIDSSGNIIANTEKGILEKLLGKYLEPEERIR